MIDLKKELKESAQARENQSLHIREVSKTRTDHKCKYCNHLIDIGSRATVVTEEILNQFVNKVFYKTYYYHHVCFLQKQEDSKMDVETKSES